MPVLFRDFMTWSTDAQLFLGFMVILGATIAGFITNIVMADRGFGVVGNACLIILGTVVGLDVAWAHPGAIHIDDATRLSLFAGSGSCLILVSLGTAKSWLATA